MPGALRSLQAKNTARRASVQEELQSKKASVQEELHAKKTNEASRDAAIVLIQANARVHFAKQRYRDANAGADLGVPGKEGCVEVAPFLSGLGPTPEGSVSFLSVAVVGRGVVGLSGLVEYPHLTSVDVSHNRLRTLAALSALPRLSSVKARCNMLSAALDFHPKAGSALRHADLSANCIAHLRGVEHHPQVRTAEMAPRWRRDGAEMASRWRRDGAVVRRPCPSRVAALSPVISMRSRRDLAAISPRSSSRSGLTTTAFARSRTCTPWCT